MPSNIDGPLGSRRIKQLYAATSTISTSDERFKIDIAELEDEVLDPWAFGLLCHDAWEAEHEAVHEQVEARIAKIEQGEDGNEVEVVEVFMEDRATGEQRLVHAAGDRFSIRYEEALAMEAAYQRRRAERIEARLAAIGA